MNNKAFACPLVKEEALCKLNNLPLFNYISAFHLQRLSKWFIYHKFNLGLKLRCLDTTVIGTLEMLRQR